MDLTHIYHVNKNESIWTKKQTWIGISIAFFVSFIPRLIYAVQMQPFLYPIDELSNISSIGILYPIQWNEVLLTDPKYYGGGFSFLLFFLFKYIKDPLIVYRSIVVIFSAVQATGAVIALIILKRHFSSIPFGTSVVFALASYNLTARVANDIINESILYPLLYLLIYLLFEISDNNENALKRRVLCLIMSFVAGYCCSIHERMVILIPMFFILWVCYWWVTRRSVFSIPLFITGYIPGYLLSRFIKHTIVSLNFSSVDGTVRNASVVSGGFSINGLISNFKPYALSVIGPVVTVILISSGIAMIGIVLFWTLFGQSIFIRNEMSLKLTENNQLNKIFIGVIFLATAVMAIALYQPISWLRDLSNALANKNYTDDSLRIFTYGRYFAVFLDPLCLISMLYIYLFKESKECRWIVGISCAISVVLNIIWIRYIYGMIQYSPYANYAWQFFGFGNKNGSVYYLWGSIILFILIIFRFFMVRYKKIVLLTIVIGVFSLCQYVYRLQAVDLASSTKSVRSTCINTYYGICKAHSNEWKNNIYVYQGYATIYQFMFFDDTIHVGYPDYNVDEGVVIADNYSDYSESLNYGWKCVKFNAISSDYVFIKGNTITSDFEKNGFSLVNFQPIEYILDSDRFYMSSTDEDSETATKTIKSKSNYSFYEGTYSVVVNGDAAKDPSLRLILVTGNTGRYIVSQVLEDGRCTFSVPYSGKMSVRLRSDSDKFVYPERMSIAKISEDVNFSIISQPSLEKITNVLKECESQSITFLNNYTLDNIDFSNISERTGCIIETKNENEILENEATFVLCFTDSDWQRLLGPYKVNTYTSAFVLLEKRTAASEYFYSIKKDYGMRALLTKGTYHFRFSLEKSIKNKDADIFCYVIAASSSNGSGAFGYIKKIPATIVNKKTCEAELQLDGDLKHWAIALFDSQGNPLSCSYIRYNKTQSVIEQTYSIAADLLSEFVNMNDYKGDIVVCCKQGEIQSELIQSNFSKKIRTDAHLTFFFDIQELPEFAEDELVLINGSNLNNVFSMIKNGFHVLDVRKNCVLMNKTGAIIQSETDDLWQIDLLQTSFFIHFLEKKRLPCLPVLISCI